MFGRRNPDQPSVNVPSASREGEIALDLLPDLPDIPAPAHESPPTVPQGAPPSDPAWYASAPVSYGYSAPPAPAAPSTPAPSEPAPWLAAPPPIAGPAPLSAPAPSQKTASESVIGPDDFFDGRYRSERGVRIQGNARGSIESRQYIFVEGGAQVDADLVAEDITVAGSFNGKIECHRRLEVTGTGKVQGHVQTVLLVVQEGGMLDGELSMRGTDAAPAAPQDDGQQTT